MKVLLVGINAKYIHSNLALFDLQRYAQAAGYEVEIAEYTINHQKDYILEEIYKTGSDVIGISCYVWNFDYVEDIIRELKKVRKDCKIWLGGPEVSFYAARYLEGNSDITGIMVGEGEITFTQLCGHYNEPKEHPIEEIPGLVYRDELEMIHENREREVESMDRFPFPYDQLQAFEHRILYYETSRGCPYRCSYCMSSLDKKLRFKSLDIVEKDLQFFLDHKVPQVKFVDRTFNCDHKHAMGVWQYIYDHDNQITNFHFEIAADILTDQEVELLNKMRPGLVQLEIGVQSTNVETIREIHRVMNFERVSEVVRKVMKPRNIHQHLDLIAGLPYEGMTSFERSFNDVFGLRPDQLQMGFLKVLKGSYMYEHAQDYGLIYHDKPPYEVLYTKWLSYQEILELKKVEEMLEVYYNSGQFEVSIELVLAQYESAYSFFREIGLYYEANELYSIKHSRIRRSEILLAFVDSKEQTFSSENRACIAEALVFDLYLREDMKSRPSWAKPTEKIKRKKEKGRRIHIEKFNYDYISMMKSDNQVIDQSIQPMYVLFDYDHRDPLSNQAKVFQWIEDPVAEILARFDKVYGTKMFTYLTYDQEKPWQLLIAVMLSAQCTDARVNMVTPVLFNRYPTVEELARADSLEVEEIIHSIGFYHNKAKNVVATAQKLCYEFHGIVPETMEELISLPGVGRKTANVILGNIYNQASVVVDTHVKRISKRLGLTREMDPVKVEYDLMKVLPKDHWTLYNLQVISFGRTLCKAQRPDCENCFLNDLCHSGDKRC